jgi:hypothetical protein
MVSTELHTCCAAAQHYIKQAQLLDGPSTSGTEVDATPLVDARERSHASETEATALESLMLKASSSQPVWPNASATVWLLLLHRLSW